MIIQNLENLGRTIHPTESFTWNHLEVNPLVTILGVDQVREFYSVELLGYHAIEVDECGGHPETKVSFDSV